MSTTAPARTGGGLVEVYVRQDGLEIYERCGAHITPGLLRLLQELGVQVREVQTSPCG
jgi:hypothetical protein